MTRPLCAVQGDAVLRPRQVLGREPEVDRVASHVVQGPRGRELGLERLLAAVHRRRRLADHLDVAQRVVEVVAAEVEVVEAERLLEDRRIRLLGEGQHGPAVVERVVASELVGPVGEAVRVLLGGRGEQQLGGVGRSARDDDDVRAVGLADTVAVDGDLRHGRAARVGVERHGLRVRQQRDVGVLERRAHRQHLRVGLGVNQAREAVAGGAADAVAVRHVGLVQHHPAGGVEGLVSGGGEVVRELLDPRLVRHRREGVRRAGGRLGRILAACAVHLVELLGLRVVRLHLVVADGPGGRDAVVVPKLAEVLRAQPVERRPVHLRGSPDEVVHLRLERLARPVVPGVLRDVAVVDEHVRRAPVLRLARQPVAALQQQDALAGGSEAVHERAAAGAAADHDDVVGAHVVYSSSRSVRMIRAPASISARWENACGKLPRCLPVLVSNSSA